MKHWQENMLTDLVFYFETHEEVLGLLLFGSLSQPEFQPDTWSDIDLLVVVQEGKLDLFFPTVQWIENFGKLYTYSQSADNFKCTTRACFNNFNRVDFVMTTEARLAEIERWQSIPFFSGTKVLFSRSEIIDKIADRTFPRPRFSTTQEQFLELVRNFRSKSTLAVYKVIRNDLLIALHLAYDLVCDCSVLGMMIRDQTTGTNIHKQGGIGNLLVRQLEVTQKPFTSIGILDSIRASHEAFEELAHLWSSDYQNDGQFFMDWIEEAKGEIGRGSVKY